MVVHVVCACAALQGWLLGSSGGWAWMDPRSNATDFVASLLVDAAVGYGLPSVTPSVAGPSSLVNHTDSNSGSSNGSGSGSDKRLATWSSVTKGLAGVQLDDHFAFPADLAGGVGLSPAAATAAMTAAAAELSAYVRAAISLGGPSGAAISGTTGTGGGGGSGGALSVVLGLAPGTLDQALGSFNVDWRAWGAVPPPPLPVLPPAPGLPATGGSGDTAAAPAVAAAEDEPLFDEVRAYAGA